jgi:hypothetical protein
MKNRTRNRKNRVGNTASGTSHVPGGIFTTTVRFFASAPANSTTGKNITVAQLCSDLNPAGTARVVKIQSMDIDFLPPGNYVTTGTATQLEVQAYMVDASTAIVPITRVIPLSLVNKTTLRVSGTGTLASWHTSTATNVALRIDVRNNSIADNITFTVRTKMIVAEDSNIPTISI